MQASETTPVQVLPNYNQGRVTGSFHGHHETYWTAGLRLVAARATSWRAPASQRYVPRQVLIATAGANAISDDGCRVASYHPSPAQALGGFVLPPAGSGNGELHGQISGRPDS